MRLSLAALLACAALARADAPAVAPLADRVPAAPDASSLAALLARSDFALLLAQRQFTAKIGAANLEAFAAAGAGHRDFVRWLLGHTEALEAALEGATPIVPAQREADTWTFPAAALGTWCRIWEADPDSRGGLYLRLAIATALNPPGTGNPGAGQSATPADPLARYRHFKAAHRNGELFPTFAALGVWELRQVVSSNASDEDLAWGRAMVNAWMPQLKDGQRVVETTSAVWYRNSPIAFSNTFRNVIAGGGKCGPRSSWGVFICQAWGIPAIGLAQPAHAAVAYKDRDGHWKTAYGRSWAASRTALGPGPEFFEGTEQRRSLPRFMEIERLRWLAAALAADPRAEKVRAVAAALAASPQPDDPPVALLVAASRPAPPAHVEPGVIHIEAASFVKDGGITVWGGHPGVVRVDSSDGGQQAFFQGSLASAWAGYAIRVPTAGVYALTAKSAAVNLDQSLFVRSFGAMLPVAAATAEHVYRNNEKDFGAARAVDRDPGTRWSANEGNDRCWLEFDLGRPEQIRTVMIDERAWNRITKFNVQYEAAGAWRTLFEGTDIGIDFMKDFEPVTTRRVRLNILDTREQMGFGPTIWDFSVGAVHDGRAWLRLPLSHGLWAVTDPVEISLVQGDQLLWVFAPFQRSVAVKWFELRPAAAARGSSPPRPALRTPEREQTE